MIGLDLERVLINISLIFNSSFCFVRHDNNYCSTQLYADNLNLIVWFVCLGIRLGIANILNYLHSPECSAEDGVLVVQPGLY